MTPRVEAIPAPPVAQTSAQEKAWLTCATAEQSRGIGAEEKGSRLGADPNKGIWVGLQAEATIEAAVDDGEALREKAVVRPLATGCSGKASRCDWGTCRSSVQNGDDGDGLAVQVFMLCLAAFAFWSVALWHAEDRRSIHRSPMRRQTLQVNAPLTLMGRAGVKNTPHAIMKFQSIWI